VDWITNVG
jgi:hypothetical protein